MFDKLRNAFSLAVKSFGEKELKDKDIEEVIFELEVALLESDVATEVIDSIKDDLKKQLVGTIIQKDKITDFVKQSLRQSISSMFDSAGRIDILSNIQKKKEKGDPYIVSFMGINGTGKTTTIAKFAHLLRENKISSVIAAADTFRAGAIEQIQEHGKRLNIKVIAQNYGSDPAAVARDAVLYSKSHKIDCVLIDTAGRMQTSKNLMDQISKINKVVNPDLKLFVGDALAGNDTVSQAREFHNYTNFDGAILTKSDADARGGAAISIVKVTSTPVVYLGVGQEYKDLKPFDKDAFLDTIFGQQQTIPEILIAKEKSQQKVESEHHMEELAKSVPQESPEIKAEETKKFEIVEPKLSVSQETKIEKEQEQKSDIKMEQKSKQETKQETKISKDQFTIEDKDPFAGLQTIDIETYSDLYDVPPPENDNEASILAAKIKKWISDGRPKLTEQIEKEEVKEEEGIEVEKQKNEKSKKKHSLFGWMKK